MTIHSSKYFFMYILTSNRMFVIPRFEVNLIKVAVPLDLFKKVVNPMERILVLNGDFIELSIINTHPKGPILLLNK